MLAESGFFVDFSIMILIDLSESVSFNPKNPFLPISTNSGPSFWIKEVAGGSLLPIPISEGRPRLLSPSIYSAEIGRKRDTATMTKQITLESIPRL